MAFKPPPKFAREELKNYALRLLGVRAISTAQLKERLRRRAAVEGDVDAVIEALREYGYLNDRRFAEGFAAARRDSRGFGSRRVLSDLLQKRVAPKVAERAVHQAFEGTDETALIEGFLARKYRGRDLHALLQAERELRSAYRKLRAAGFAGGASIRVLKRFAARAVELEDGEESDPEPS